MQRRAVLLAVCVILSASAVRAASPRLNIIQPRGVQRGAEHVLTFSGSNLGDAEEVFFYDQGFEVAKVEPNGNNVAVTVKVAPDTDMHDPEQVKAAAAAALASQSNKPAAS